MGRTRNPARTRQALIEAGFDEIYARGFQAASVDAIIRKAGVTKGAFFHHFAGKKAFGYALVDEHLSVMLDELWLEPLRQDANPLRGFARAFAGAIEQLETSPAIFGCPLNNLAQEMAPIDEGFRERIDRLFARWIDTLEAALDGGRRAGYVDRRVPTRETAFFLVAQVEGVVSLAKGSADPALLRLGLRNVKRYLRSLRPVQAA